MAKAGRYLRLRRGVFYYHRRLPKDVLNCASQSDVLGSGPIFRRSLKTKNRAEALANAAQIEAIFSREVDRLRGLQNTVTGHATAGLPISSTTPREITDRDLEKLADDVRNRTSRKWRELVLVAETDEDARSQLEDLEYLRGMDAEEIFNSITKVGYSSQFGGMPDPVDVASKAISENNWFAPPGSLDHALVVKTVRNALREGHREIDGLLDGTIAPKKSDTYLQNQGGDTKPITLREAVSRYLNAKQSKPKTQRDIERSLQMFEKIVGNRLLDDLTKADFREFLKVISKKTVGGRSKGSIERPISENTVKKRLKFLSAAINFAQTRGWFEGMNPAQGHDVSAWVKPRDPLVNPDKRPFTDEELNLIFQHPLFVGCRSATDKHTPGSYRQSGKFFWVPVVALYSGMRAAELGGLKISEVRLDERYPHFLVRENEYRTIKGDRPREVPILDALLELGFGEYYRRIGFTGAERLFPDWELPKSVGRFDRKDARWSNVDPVRSFNRTVVPKMLGHRLNEEARLEVTFHSLRGAFKSMLGLNEYRISPNIIHEVVGHSKSDLDQRYVGTVPLSETYSAVRACRFASLHLPAAP